jgi:hypothetical protein
VNSTVGELDRGLQMRGNVLRENGRRHRVSLYVVWIILKGPSSSMLGLGVGDS